jgi:hypothetical protein
VIKGLSKSVIALGAAAAVVAGGGAYTAIASTAQGKISVCVKHKGGTLYKARRCASHDKRLTWNARGPRGPRGFRGPQGPGGKVVTWGATASASPTAQLIATILGVKYYGTCADSSGAAVASLKIQTTQAFKWDYDVSVSDSAVSANNGTFTNQIDAPALTTATTLTQATAATGGNETAQKFHVTQLTPAPGALELFLNANTGTAETCHASLLYYPTGPISSIGSGVRVNHTRPLPHPLAPTR